MHPHKRFYHKPELKLHSAARPVEELKPLVRRNVWKQTTSVQTPQFNACQNAHVLGKRGCKEQTLEALRIRRVVANLVQSFLARRITDHPFKQSTEFLDRHADHQFRQNDRNSMFTTIQ
jgi:hypothetical protein